MKFFTSINFRVLKSKNGTVRLTARKPSKALRMLKNQFELDQFITLKNFKKCNSYDVRNASISVMSVLADPVFVHFVENIHTHLHRRV